MQITLKMNLQTLSKIGVVGYTGKLGAEILKEARTSTVEVVMMANRARWMVEEKPQVVINVSHPGAVPSAVEYCLEHNIPLIEGTSGLETKEMDMIQKASLKIPVVRAENFSFGNFIQVQLLHRLIEIVKNFPGEKELSIIDRHTTRKKDRPSATALLLGKIWESKMEQGVSDIASVRGGLPVSDHTAWLTLSGEEVQIFHRVTDRAAAARGALMASRYILQQKPSYRTMSDVYLSGM